MLGTNELAGASTVTSEMWNNGSSVISPSEIISDRGLVDGGAIQVTIWFDQPRMKANWSAIFVPPVLFAQGVTGLATCSQVYLSYKLTGPVLLAQGITGLAALSHSQSYLSCKLTT